MFTQFCVYYPICQLGTVMFSFKNFPNQIDKSVSQIETYNVLVVFLLFFVNFIMLNVCLDGCSDISVYMIEIEDSSNVKLTGTVNYSYFSPIVFLFIFARSYFVHIELSSIVLLKSVVLRLWQENFKYYILWTEALSRIIFSFLFIYSIKLVILCAGLLMKLYIILLF